MPAVRSGKIVKEELKDETPSGTQGFFFNLRRAKFADIRVRRALDLAFDFEWASKNLFFGAYKRTTSYFENSDMKATGLPSPEELALLEPFRAQLAPEVFGEAVMPAVSDGSGGDRKNLGEAQRLLLEAGCKLVNGIRLDPSGQPFAIEFLLDDDGFVRVLDKYVDNLKRLGFKASVRVVDPTQYLESQRRFDYDVVTTRYVLQLTPGVELRSYFGSKAADQPASQNGAGIKDPVVDALIEKVVAAKSRAELNTATRALDRVLRAGRYWVPEWYGGVNRLAYWDRFGRPAVKPRFERGVLETWWFDQAKADRLGKP